MTYGKNWDLYYQRTYKKMKKKALWDVPVEEAVVEDRILFESYFNKNSYPFHKPKKGKMPTWEGVTFFLWQASNT